MEPRGTTMTQQSERAGPPRAAAEPSGRDDALLAARARLGIWVIFCAIVLFTLADLALAGGGSVALHLARVAQLALIGAAAALMRARPLGRRARLAVMTAFVAGIYLTSAVAGALRPGANTQPITGLALAFGTATTLPWGPWRQLASVLAAAVALLLNVYLVEGTLAGVSAHLAAGVAVALLASVYIAGQLERYRRERERAERALRRSEERFRSLVERGSDVIGIVDAGGVIRYQSPPVERVLGLRPEEIVGTEATRYVHPQDRDAVAAAVERATASGGVDSVECRLRRRDGSWCHVEAVLTDLRAHPAVRGLVFNWRDVSERRRAEEDRARYMRELAAARDQAFASTRAKSQFLANVSHEIRTPMNVIIGTSEMVLDGDLAPEPRRHVERIRSAALTLLEMINDVLDASKIEAGKMALEVVDLDVRRVVEAVADLLGPAAAAKEILLETRVAADLPGDLRGDPLRLRQVITNLVHNAIKFTDAGRVTIEVRMLRAGAEGTWVRVAVTDTGAGIPAERHAAVFESFAQADDSTSRTHGGTGLGLAICRQLVELMGGTIDLDSEPGRGSTFWFEIPLARAAAGAETRAP
jgi:PAS domain S-box-containing protein